MAAARRERPASSLRVTLRPSRLALVLIVFASALAALAITRSSLAESPFALAIWAALALAVGLFLRSLGTHAGGWLFDENPDGIGRLRSASGSIDEVPTLWLRNRTCWPFLLVIGTVESASRRSQRLVLMIDALSRDDFRRLAVWLRRAHCAPDADPE